MSQAGAGHSTPYESPGGREGWLGGEVVLASEPLAGDLGQPSFLVFSEVVCVWVGNYCSMYLHG